MELDVAHPVVLRAGEGESVGARAEHAVVIKAEHELVDVIELRYAAGEPGPGPHVHREHADAFYVLEGEPVFKLGPGGERVSAPAGTCVLAPAGVIHGFDNEGPSDTRLLNVHAPSMRFAESLRARRHLASYDAARFDSFGPPADGGRPLSDAVVRPPGDGDVLDLGTSRAVFKAEGSDGDGTFALTEVTLAPGFPGPVPHRHQTLVDSFYVLEGTVTVRIGDGTVAATAGSYVFVPPGNVHTFSNTDDAPARLLNLMAPGGFEQYLKEVARSLPRDGGPPDPRTMARIASRYDFHPAE